MSNDNISRCFLLLCTAATVLAGPLWSRQSTQQVNINWTVSDTQFKSFENPTTLKQYFQSKGYSNLNLNFNQLSQGVADIDQYLAQKAAQTGGASSSSNQFPILDDSPIQTKTNSTSLKNGPSYTNNSLSAEQGYVEAISFSDGNAATAGGAIQKAVTVSSTSSSGASNSTATVTGTSQVAQIKTNAIVNGATDSRQIDGSPKDALSGGSCAARATGASARALILTTLNIPVNTTGTTSVTNVARSFCEAGVSAKKAGKPGGTGTSSSGMQAALTNGGVKVSVTCNGKTVSSSPSISFTLVLRGTYAANSGFKGMFTGSRMASAQTSCS